MITEYIVAFHYSHARETLDQAGITPLRITEVQSLNDEDLVSSMFIKNKEYNERDLFIFFFLLFVTYLLFGYGIYKLINYVHALFQ